MIRALIARNAYEIVLSCVMLLILFALGLVGSRMVRKLAGLEPGWKPPYPFTANAGEPTIVSGLDVKIPLFFRLHFVVRGKYKITTKSTKDTKFNNFYAETSVARGESVAKIDIDFPMSGIFQGEGVCKLRDIFGFFSFTCGVPLHRTLNVRSAPCLGTHYYVNAQSGAEDKRNKHSPDEERYYMREYTPGDRLRDINWKSSEKIDTLITRISPDNQEKVSRIEVYFRNFGNTKNPSLEELWLLDRAKARLSHFLRTLREQQSNFIFDVRVAGRLENWEIHDEESLDEFLEDLAGISFVPVQNESATDNKNGELYIFSTQCDTGLSTFLLSSTPRPVSLFLIRCAAAPLRVPEGSRPNREEIELLYKRDFLLKGIIPNPKWLFRGKIKPMTVQVTKTENHYAGTKL